MSPGNYKLHRKIQRVFKRLKPLLLCSLLLHTSCAFKKVPGTNDPSTLKTDTFKTSKVEPEARTLFFQAERLYFNKNYDHAAPVYQQVKTKFPRGKATQLSSYRLGSIYYYQGNYPAAEREFDSFLTRFPQSELTFDVTYNLAAAQYQLEHYPQAHQTISRLKWNDIQNQGPKRAETVYQLTGQIASAMDNSPAAVAAYAAQLQVTLSEGNRRNVEENIDSHLAKITSPTDLSRLAQEIKEPGTRNKILSRLAQVNPPFHLATAPIEAEAEGKELVLRPSSSSGERTNVGIILPLSGKFATYGKKALDGILAASQVFSERETSLRLFIEDSESNPALAQAAVEKLVRNYNVIALIGPLNVKEAIAVAEKSQELGVLNLSLSGKEGIAEKGAYLFQNALTPRVQLDNLVEYSIHDRNLKRFAILAPDNAFGKDMANAFWDAVEAKGGVIVAHETYAPEEKDFQSTISNLVGVSNAKYRPMEWRKLNEWVKSEKEKGRKEPRIKLEPLIDFDAIFIPDGPKQAGSIAASLAYYDVTGVPLLGTTEWNSDQLYKRGGRYVEGAIFPGGITSGTKSQLQRDFIKQYIDAYGTAPDLLATQSYEAMYLISHALQKSGSSSRNEIVEEVARIQNVEGPLGAVSFENTRVARRKLPVYSLESGGTIVEQ